MRNNIIVTKLIAYAEKLQSYCEGLDYEHFTADMKLVEACVFNLSQMGELANRVDEGFAEAHPEVPWRQLYGLRNGIVHDYEGVNLRLVWEIIEGDIPELTGSLRKI